MSLSREGRVRALVAAARRIADARDPLGVAARAELPSSTGLSPEGVALALERCLETDPTDAEIAALVASVPEVPGAHVLLSANVFVAPHRAIALALAASARVFTRPSRREPVMTRLLSQGAPDLFAIVPRLQPSAGDHVWAYGADTTLVEVAKDLPAGVVLHRHGPGFGVVVIDEPGPSSRGELAEAVAWDVAAFDQRGCLSPRVVLVSGSADAAGSFAGELSEALSRIERRVPLGRLTPEETAHVTRFRDAWLVAGALHPAGRGFVGFDPDRRPVVVPPVGRNVHVRWTPDLPEASVALSGKVTSVGVAGPPELVALVRSLFPGARVTAPGTMQRPPFDGPVDLRS